MASKSPPGRHLRRRLARLLRAVDACHALLESLVAASARHRRRLQAPGDVERRRLLRRGVSERVRRLRSELLVVSHRFAAISSAMAAAAAATAAEAAAAAGCTDIGDEASTRDDGPSTSSLGVPTSETTETLLSAPPPPRPPPQRAAIAVPADAAAAAAAADSSAALRRAISRRLAQSRRLLDCLAADLLPPGDAAAVVRVSLQLQRPPVSAEAEATSTADTAATRSLNNCRRAPDHDAVDGHGDRGGGIAFHRVLGDDAAAAASGPQRRLRRRGPWRLWWN